VSELFEVAEMESFSFLLAFEDDVDVMDVAEQKLCDSFGQTLVGFALFS
jgi:hypothetical protein